VLGAVQKAQSKVPRNTGLPGAAYLKSFWTVGTRNASIRYYEWTGSKASKVAFLKLLSACPPSLKTIYRVSTKCSSISSFYVNLLSPLSSVLDSRGPFCIVSSILFVSSVSFVVKRGSRG
jgi:hypothetical protein